MLRFKCRAAQRTDSPPPAGMAPALWRLLCARGVDTPQAAQDFLHPDASQIADPFTMPGMREAVERIQKAVDRDEAIVVYGDYDVDGVCASAILHGQLRAMGARCEVYLPSRHTEGYGLNEAAVRSLAQEHTLLVTVDCGISSAELVALAQSLGMDVVVTDHHQPPETLPDCVVVNPHVGDYGFPDLCGAGVAFQLARALSDLNTALGHIDLAAIATVADIVPLTGENRAIVACGLKRLNLSPRPGVAALMRSAGMEGKPLFSETIAFQLGPRLNAGGRLADASLSFQLLTGSDDFELAAIADRLNTENARRQTLEKEILAQAEAMLKDFDFPSRRAIVVAGEDWNVGVIGLAASRLTEKYHMPSIAISLRDGVGTGSCRSIPGVDIYRALCACESYLTRFGGHTQAAGLSLPAENIAAFSRALDEHLFATVDADAYIPECEYDLALPLEEADADFIESLDRLQPTGFGNPAPVFLSRGNFQSLRRCGRDGAHLQFSFAGAHASLSGVYFRAGALADALCGEYDVAYTLSMNKYRGRRLPQMQVKALKPAENGAKNAIQQEHYALQHAILTQLLYTDSLSAPEVLSLDALDAHMAGNQGTLLIAATEEALLWAAQRYPGIDVFCGVYPTDPRAFHALSFCPAGTPGVRYSQVVALDLPFHPACTARLDRRFSSSWLKDLPDIPALREFYRAARAYARAGGSANGDEHLAQILAQSCSSTRVAAFAAVLLLRELGLIRLDAARRLTVPAGMKVDMESSQLYTRMRALVSYAMEVD